MKSRDRILAAINHQQPDRIPVNPGSAPISGISATVHNILRDVPSRNIIAMFDAVKEFNSQKIEIK